MKHLSTLREIGSLRLAGDFVCEQARLEIAFLPVSHRNQNFRSLCPIISHPYDKILPHAGTTHVTSPHHHLNPVSASNRQRATSTRVLEASSRAIKLQALQFFRFCYLHHESNSVSSSPNTASTFAPLTPSCITGYAMPCGYCRGFWGSLGSRQARMWVGGHGGWHVSKRTFHSF